MKIYSYDLLLNKCNIYVDQVFKELLEPVISRETLQIHPVTKLYEICQKKNLKVTFEDLWKENMEFNVFVDDQLAGKATYGLKKDIAHNRAAMDALNNIERILRERDNVVPSIHAHQQNVKLE